MLCHKQVPMPFFLFSPKIKIFKVVNVFDLVKKNMFHFFEKFEHKGHTLLVLEILDLSLLQLLIGQCGEPLSLAAIRPIMHQVKTKWLR